MRRNRSKRVEVQLDIHSLAQDGEGIGSYIHPVSSTESPALVPFTAPGDKVEVLLLKKRSGVYSTRLLNILHPSPIRQSARCPHFSECGGCSWQHIPYSFQLKEKERRVHALFEPLLNPDTRVHPILESEEWHYRNKMEYTFSKDRLGLYKAKSRGWVIDISSCSIAPEWFNDALAATKKWWQKGSIEAYVPHRNSGSLRTLHLREGKKTGNRMAILTVSGEPQFALTQEHINDFKTELIPILSCDDSCYSLYLCIQIIAPKIPTRFQYILLGGQDAIEDTLSSFSSKDKDTEQRMIFSISPSAFFQPNPLQAEKLYHAALKLAEFTKNSIVYDLYCGTATIGLLAASMAKHVYGIELNESAVMNANLNISRNEIKNMTVFQGDVAQVLNEQQSLLPKPDLLIVDPPRAGLSPDALELLCNLNAQTILYISCNPTTQAQNIKEILMKGYFMKAIQPVDQFPQTPHIENIVVLQKSP